MPSPFGATRSSFLTSNERRSYPRLRALGSATLHPTDNLVDPGMPVTLSDISHEGICFLAAKELVPETQIVLDLQSSDDPPQHFIREATVCWCTPDQAGEEFLVGCSWIVPLGLDDLLRFC